MPIAAADLLEPTGEVAPELFPGDAPPPAAGAGTLLGRLATYLADGYARAAAVADATQKDEAARQWAYRRAFRAKYQEMNRKASTVDVKDEASRSFLVTQIQNFKALADEAEETYAAIPGVLPVVAEPPAAAAVAAPPVSRSTANLIAW